jgi:hypothetical protein
MNEAHLYVRYGYDRDRIIATLTTTYEDSVDSCILVKQAQRAADEAITEFLAEQKGWPEVTDNDRLQLAVAELESCHILCACGRSHCQLCGLVDTWRAIEDSEEQEVAVRGYLFFAEYDIKSALNGYGLYISYGSTEEGEEAGKAIGEEIVRTLKRYELKARWNGSMEERIHIEMKWRKRWQFDSQLS